MRPSLLAALLAAALGAAACAPIIPPATALVDGAFTAAPAGWVSYCDRHAEDSGCPR